MTGLVWLLAQLGLITGLLAWALTVQGLWLLERSKRERAEAICTEVLDELRLEVRARHALQRQVQGSRLVEHTPVQAQVRTSGRVVN